MHTARADDKSAKAVAGPLLLVIVCMAILLLPATGLAQSEDDQNIEQLTEGQQVYNDICQSCHQPGGVGLPGAFPPLIDNPNVEDTEYVRGVIENGLSGEIVVNGESYNGTMPPQTSLDDGQIEAVIAFLQAGLVVPGGGDGTAEPETSGPVAGTTLPPAVATLTSFAWVIAVGIALWVLGPRIVGVIDHRSPSRLDAALKGGLIVIYFAVTTVLLPSLLLSTEVMTRLPEGVQVFVATAVWGGALGIGIVGLWWFQRESRI